LTVKTAEEVRETWRLMGSLAVVMPCVWEGGVGGRMGGEKVMRAYYYHY